MSLDRICICGGGSLGLVCAGVFLSQGLNVNILSGHPAQWRKEIKVFDPNGKEYGGRLGIVSDNPSNIIPFSKIVLLCVPGYLIEQTLLKIQPYLNKDCMVGSIVSSTGFFFIAHKILPNDIELFGFQRVPFIARQREYGSIGDLLGYKPSLNVVIENSRHPESSRKCLERLFMTPVKLLNNYYEASLTNSNPILHTGRLFSLWGKEPVKPVKEQINFYGDWTDDASEYLIRMDSEFQTLISALGIKDGTIPTLLSYYESTDAKSLTSKIRSIEAFKPILAPMIETDEGWIPDYNNRYFKEDFPFGLRYIWELCHSHNIPCTTIDQVYYWGISKLEK